MKRQRMAEQFVVCESNDGYPSSLETRKIYQVISDPNAEKHHMLRGIFGHAVNEARQASTRSISGGIPSSREIASASSSSCLARL